MSENKNREGAPRPEENKEATERTKRLFFELIRTLCGVSAGEVGEFGSWKEEMKNGSSLRASYHLPPQEGHPMDLPPKALFMTSKNESRGFLRHIYQYAGGEMRHHVDTVPSPNAVPPPKDGDEAFARMALGVGQKESWLQENGLPVTEAELQGIINFLKTYCKKEQIAEAERRAK